MLYEIPVIRQEFVARWTRLKSGDDPSLPPELLPDRWSGTAAARLFAERHGQWADGARREWKRLNT